jgi:hypothetical protein
VEGVNCIYVVNLDTDGVRCSVAVLVSSSELRLLTSGSSRLMMVSSALVGTRTTVGEI